MMGRLSAEHLGPTSRPPALTNERGEYRLDGLYAGEFFLIALPHDPPADAKGVTAARTGFGNTFYPGVASFAEAKSVRVGPGVTPTADITLRPAPIRAVSGVVIGSSGQPVPGARNPGPQRVEPTKEDLSFACQTWPQPARIRVIIDSPEWVMKAVRHNGIDITDKPIEFLQGQAVTGLEVVITRAPARKR